MKNYRLLLAVVIVGFAIGALGQTSSAPSPVPGPTAQPAVGPTAPKRPATINQRKTDQQDRIANGLDSGQLTARETRNLETKESDVNKEENNMRKLDDGHLTGADRQTLNQQQPRSLSVSLPDDAASLAKAAAFRAVNIAPARNPPKPRPLWERDPRKKQRL